MRTSARGLLIGAALMVAFATPTPGYACSKGGFAGVQLIHGAHFIATAAPDTVHAGPGAVEYRMAPGHFGPAGERPIYGQLVDVERIGGLAAARLPPTVSRVVLVPWDYGADCTPTPWTRSARWLEPGTRGLFTAVLRDSAHWVGGIPTLDVHAPQLEPYPQGVTARRRGGSMPADSLLSIEQLFSLMDVLPAANELRQSPATAVQPLFAWARANPALARRYPAADALRYARYSLESHRVRSIAPPIAGTYRLTATLNGHPSRVFWIRSYAHASNGWNVSRKRPTSDDPTVVFPNDGYYLLASGASTEDSFAVSAGHGRRIAHEGWIGILDRPVRTRDGRTVWHGTIELDLLTRQFPADSALKQFARDDFDRFRERRGQGVPEATPARFVLHPNGVVRVEQTIDLEDGRVLKIQGERISRTVIPQR